jgi:hypothetical protein
MGPLAHLPSGSFPAGAFSAWESLLVGSLIKNVGAPGQAREVATLIVAAAGGAVAMCRAKRSTLPLD